MRFRSIWIRVLFLLFFVGACASLVDRIPPSAMSLSAIDETIVRMQLYMREHGQPPPSLAVLPVREGHCNRTTDGWGHEILYSVDEEGIITLTSLGADGKSGGEGDNADIVRRWRTRNADGSSCVNDEYWLIHAEER